MIQPYSLPEEDQGCEFCGAYVCVHNVCGCRPCRQCERETDDRFETFYRKTLRHVNTLLAGVE